MKLLNKTTMLLRRPAMRKAMGLLQARTFQHDFAPRDPKAKPKRYKYPAFYDPYGPRPSPSEKIIKLADRIAAISPDERAMIGPALILRLKHPQLQEVSNEGVNAAPASPSAGKVVEEEKKEKTSFDVKLEKFEAAAKIKVIKEVRAFTNLGLKEAKELVEKAPVVIKQGVSKDEGNDILEKIKAAGGAAIME